MKTRPIVAARLEFEPESGVPYAPEFGELLIDVGEENFQLDCNLRFTSYNSHSTEF